jgi:hypothetical protein
VTATALWDKLETTYGVRGPSFIYSKLMESMNFKVPDTQDPSSDIAHLFALFAQITSTKATLHESLQVMMFLNALPARLEFVSTHVLATKTTVDDLKLEATRAAVMAAWNTPGSTANAAHFKQQNQNKPAWQQAGQSPDLQEDKPEGEKKKRYRNHGKGKKKAAETADAAIVEDSIPEYSTASAIACLAVMVETHLTSSSPPPATHSLVERICKGRLDGMRIGDCPLISRISDQSGTSHRLSYRARSDDIIVFAPTSDHGDWVSEYFDEYFDEHSYDSLTDSGNEWVRTWLDTVAYSIEPTADGSFPDDGNYTSPMTDSRHSALIELPDAVLDGWAMDNREQHGWTASNVTDDHPSSNDGLLWDNWYGWIPTGEWSGPNSESSVLELSWFQLSSSVDIHH